MDRKKKETTTDVTQLEDEEDAPNKFDVSCGPRSASLVQVPVGQCRVAGLTNDVASGLDLVSALADALLS